MYTSFKFLSGPESVTHSIASNVATFNYSVTAKFPVDPALLERLQEEAMTVKLHRMSGHQQHVFGVGHLALAQVLHAFAKGSGVLADEGQELPVFLILLPILLCEFLHGMQYCQT
jgi:hypothetical protein